ncbi:MAG: 3'-5' exonuclease [Bacteroidales bacterium]|nr:3'-5' exonuclease [Bacteroidales bacterium]
MELDLKRPIAFIDLETTGLNIATDRIVEISIIKVLPGGDQDILTERVNPTIPIPPQTTAIHGIRDEDVKECPTFESLAPRLAGFISQCDLAGYNCLKFDFPLLAEEFLRAGIDFDLRNRRLVDVQNIFHKMEPRTLKAAYLFYCSRDLTAAHSAEADAMATYEILMAQLDRYRDVEVEDRKGKQIKPVTNDVTALSEFSFINKNADLAGHIIFNDKNQEVFNFGKYKGEPVEEVFQREPQYYDWMMKSQFPLYTKKVITAIKLRGFNNASVNIR